MSASVSTVLAFGLLLTACGGGGEAEPQVAEKCDGTLSPAAVGSLESVLRTKAYHSEGIGLERTAKALVEDQAKGGRPPGHPAMCEVITDADSRLGARIDVRLSEKDSLYDDGTKWTAGGRHLYGVGLEANTDNKSAYLFVGCTSPQLKGSDKQPAIIGAKFAFEKPVKTAYPANTPATREAYLTVLHSVTLAVVRKLGCEGDAGLPEKPVFAEKKWRGEQ
ncbi:hypothetical protein [Streptomyces sp. NPDC004266]|uniref:hypothetical protein n=1 Tax=Streptomyces sp. NPDC004266 TaxID=3364693 RepID=UPI00369A0B71